MVNFIRKVVLNFIKLQDFIQKGTKDAHEEYYEKLKELMNIRNTEYDIYMYASAATYYLIIQVFADVFQLFYNICQYFLISFQYLPISSDSCSICADMFR